MTRHDTPDGWHPIYYAYAHAMAGLAEATGNEPSAASVREARALARRAFLHAMKEELGFGEAELEELERRQDRRDDEADVDLDVDRAWREEPWPEVIRRARRARAIEDLLDGLPGGG